MNRFDNIRNVILLLSLGIAGCAEPPHETPADDSALDSGAGVPDAGDESDGGAQHDGGTGTDSGAEPDGGLQTDGGALPDGGTAPDGGTHPDGGDGALHSLTQFSDLEDFVSLAVAGTEVKFLVTHDTEQLPAALDVDCLFQNTREYSYHLHFLQSLPELEQLSAERYEDWVMWRATRTMYTGVLKLFPAAVHPATGERGVLGYAVYAASTPDERLTAQELIEVGRKLQSCSGDLAELLVYLPQSNAELDVARRNAELLAEAGVSFAAPSQLQAALEAEVYSEGEAYGFLRLADETTYDALGPRDVVLTESAPNDLGLVAALITQKPQSAVSHLNLRLREKGIPNVSAPFAFDAAVIEQLRDQLVRVHADGQRVVVEPALQEDAESFWEQHQPQLETPVSDLEVETLSPLAELRHADALAYGTKAANLGELMRVLPEVNTPPGLALPMSAYRRHIVDNGLESLIAHTIDRARQGGAPARAALDDLRDAIVDAPVPAEFEQDLFDAVVEFWGEPGLTTRLRFRSSTNVEDLTGISGAGLYDSASGCIADDLDDDDLGPSACLSEAYRAHYEAELEKARAELAEHPERTHLLELIDDLEKELTREKSARRALRKVWASLWNDRAFEDRQYYGIDHTQVFMGVAVHPALVGEQLEAVVLTNLEPESDAPYYRVVSQAGEVGVVEPSDPSAVPEHLRFRRAASNDAVEVTLVTPSSLSTDGASLWSASAVDELATLLFDLQDHFEQHVYPTQDPLQLDVEVDVTVDGRIVIKQARPYVSRL